MMKKGPPYRQESESDAVPDSEFVELDTRPVMLETRPPQETITVEDALMIWDRINRFKGEVRSRRQSDANQVMAAVNAPKIDDERLKSLEWRVKILWGLLIAALTLAGGSVGIISKYLVTYGGDSREAAIRKQELIQTVDESKKRGLNNEARIHDLELQLKGIKP